jgi:hypothetical protein
MAAYTSEQLKFNTGGPCNAEMLVSPKTRKPRSRAYAKIAQEIERTVEGLFGEPLRPSVRQARDECSTLAVRELRATNAPEPGGRTDPESQEEEAIHGQVEAHLL